MKSFLRAHAFAFMTAAIFGIFLAWFLVAPQHFKQTWRKNLLVAHIIEQHNDVQRRVKVGTLTCMSPHFPYLAEVVEKGSPDEKLRGGYYFGISYDFYPYYQKAAEFFPDNDAALALAGFCEYHRGNREKAMEYYHRALQADPYFFWNYYNLGLLYFENGDYRQSVFFLERAISLKQDITLKIIKSSEFYIQIWRHLNPFSRILEKNLEGGRDDALILLAACFLEMREPQKVLAVARMFKDTAGRHKNLFDVALRVAVSGPAQYDAGILVFHRLLDRAQFQLRIF